MNCDVGEINSDIEYVKSVETNSENPEEKERTISEADKKKLRANSREKQASDIRKHQVAKKILLRKRRNSEPGRFSIIFM